MSSGSPNIGLAGLGRMGAAMGLRLRDLGRELTVWNRSPGPRAPLERAGARVASSPAALVAQSSVLVSMLRDDGAAREVYFGAQGFLSGAGSGAGAGDNARSAATGRLFIEMSTLRPALIAELAERVRAAGGAFIEAPVSGTVGPAREGKLLALVGASPEDLARAMPVLEALCRRVVHAGPVGQGALLKLVVNLPLGVYWQALAEALALGRAGGLDYAQMLDVLQDSSAALKVLGLKIPAILGSSEAPAFDLAAMRKDLGYMLECGAQRAVPMPATSAAYASYSAAVAGGVGAQDSVAIVRYLAERMSGQDGGSGA